MTKEKLKNVLDSFINDHIERDGGGVIDTIYDLLDYGCTKEELVSELGFEEADVDEALSNTKSAEKYDDGTKWSIKNISQNKYVQQDHDNAPIRLVDEKERTIFFDENEAEILRGTLDNSEDDCYVIIIE